VIVTKLFVDAVIITHANSMKGGLQRSVNDFRGESAYFM
jgi:hypothetical protein